MVGSERLLHVLLILVELLIITVWEGSRVMVSNAIIMA